MRSKVLENIIAETPIELHDRVKAYGDFKVYPDRIRTLGLYQPYAGLMFHGKIETRRIQRGKKPGFPLGKYVLYSTQKEYKLIEVYNISGWDNYERINKIKFADKRLRITERALMVADLVRVFEITEDMPETFVKYQYDEATCLWGLEFKNIAPIEPFKIPGKQGIGFLPEEEKAQIKFI